MYDEVKGTLKGIRRSGRQRKSTVSSIHVDEVGQESLAGSDREESMHSDVDENVEGNEGDEEEDDEGDDTDRTVGKTTF